ncbi:MAG: hypothetical protein DWI24_01345 [Planctomycetota bacterium]|nr:MAG: hypothetical protein DWI24_01345 [Planctomycetota bacterium]
MICWPHEQRPVGIDRRKPPIYPARRRLHNRAGLDSLWLAVLGLAVDNGYVCTGSWLKLQFGGKGVGHGSFP